MKEISTVKSAAAPSQRFRIRRKARGLSRASTVPAGSPSALFRPLHPSWCFYAAVWGVIVGLVFCTAAACSFFASPWWLLCVALFAVIALARPSRFTLAFAFGAGFLLAGFRAAPVVIGVHQFSALVGQTVTITGTLSADPSGTALSLTDLRLVPASAAETTEVTEAAETTETAETAETASGTFILDAETVALSGTLYVKLSSLPDGLARSDLITLRGQLGAGFGTYAGSLFRPTVLAVVQPTPGDVFIKFQHAFSARVREFIPSPAVDLGLGYLLGQKDGLAEDFSEALRAVGMTHVVVASGTHLGILVDLVRRLFGKFSKFASLLFGTLAVLAFVGVVGFTPSMTRAALVTLLSLAVGYVGRQFTPVRLLSLVAALTLFIAPNNWLNLGWQLSFASFAGLLLLAPALTRLFYGGKDPPWLATMLLTSLATCLTCAPVLIYNFGTISLLSFVANLIILPTLPYAMLLVFVTGLAGSLATFLSPFAALATLFGRLAGLLLDFHIWLVNALSQQTTFILELTSGQPLIFLWYLPLLVALAIITRLCYNERYDHRPQKDR